MYHLVISLVYLVYSLLFAILTLKIYRKYRIAKEAKACILQKAFFYLTLLNGLLFIRMANVSLLNNLYMWNPLQLNFYPEIIMHILQLTISTIWVKINLILEKS